MTTAGWIIMGFSVGSVTLLFGWCLARVLSAPPPEASGSADETQ